MPITDHADPVIAAAQSAFRRVLAGSGNDVVAQRLDIRRKAVDEMARGRRLLPAGVAREVAEFEWCDSESSADLIAYANQIEAEGFPPRQ